MQKRIKFQAPKDVTSPSLDGIEILFPFTVVDSSLIGKPEERQKTKSHKIVVKITDTLRTSWGLTTDEELIKVLFERGRRHVEEKVRTRALKDEEKIVLSTSNADEECPYDSSKIKDPDGYEAKVEEEKPKIGFY